MKIDISSVGKPFTLERLKKGVHQLDILGTKLEISFPDADIIQVSDFGVGGEEPIAVRHYSHSKKSLKLNIIPKTLPHPVLVHLREEMTIGAKDTCDFNILIPIAYNLKTTEKSQLTLAEFNPPPLKHTWYGPTTKGNLCYKYVSDIIMDAEGFTAPPFTILVPLKITNERDESFTLPPIRLDDDLLFIHLLGDTVTTCEVGVNIQEEGGIGIHYPDSSDYPKKTMLFPRKREERGPLTRSLFDLMGIKDDEGF